MKTKVQYQNDHMKIHNDRTPEVSGTSLPDGDGYTPVELLTSSLGLCVFITLSRLLERDKVEIDESSFYVTVEAEKADSGPSRVKKLTVEVCLPEHLDDAYQDKLVRSAEKACTISNTLQHGADIIIHREKGKNCGK